MIKNATAEDSGTYGCTATNDISEQVVDLPERVYLRVQHEGNGGYRFVILGVPCLLNLFVSVFRQDKNVLLK